jgi:hypothetical protein
MAWAPTDAQILNLNPVRRRFDAFRFVLCDRDMNPIGELHPDRTGTVPTISSDVSDSTSRRLSNFKLSADEAQDVNPVSDRLRVYMVLQNGSQYLLGTFLWASEDQPIRSWGLEKHHELLDYSFILNQKSTQVFNWSRGAVINLIMLFLMGRAGLEMRDIGIIGDEANRGLREPRAWAGETWANMINNMGVGCGFAPVWFNNEGKGQLDIAPTPETSPPNVPEYELNTRVIADSILYSNDVLNAPNEWGIFDSGTSQMIAGRYQLPASAPNSFQKRGFRIGDVDTVQGLTSQALADKAALGRARNSDVYEYLHFQSTLDPRHAVSAYNIVPAFGKVWAESSWSMELRSGGKHEHSLKRIFYDIV